MSNSSANIREIAKRAGVSTASVSRALNGVAHKLSDEKRRQILELCRELKYEPNIHTRRQFAKRAGVVAFAYPAFARTECADMPDINLGKCLMGAQEALGMRGFELLLMRLDAQGIAEKRYLRMIRNRGIDGLLLWGCLAGDEYISEILEENTPLVMLQTVRRPGECSSVVADDFTGMDALCERAAKCGHRRFAVMPPQISASAGRFRLEAQRHFFAGHPELAVHYTQTSGFLVQDGAAAAAELLAAGPPPDCLLCPNDFAAIGAIEEFERRGVRVPEDLSVTGADGVLLPGGKHTISSYDAAAGTIGRSGAELLCGHIEGEKIISEQTIPVTPISGDTLRGSQAASQEVFDDEQ